MVTRMQVFIEEGTLIPPEVHRYKQKDAWVEKYCASTVSRRSVCLVRACRGLILQVNVIMELSVIDGFFTGYTPKVL